MEIGALLKTKTFQIYQATPCYGTIGTEWGGSELMPAYQLHGASGQTIVISALTGQVL